MNKQEETRRVEKCIRKTSDIITIRAVESGKQEASVNGLQHMTDGQFDEYTAGKNAQGDDSKPVAPASMNIPARLEDLSDIERELLIERSDGFICGIFYYSHYTPMEHLIELGYAQKVAHNKYAITPEGMALVRDYQRRQAASQPSAVNNIWWDGLPDKDKWTLLKDESKRREALEAENARLQAELDAARAQLVTLTAANRVQSERLLKVASIYREGSETDYLMCEAMYRAAVGIDK